MDKIGNKKEVKKSLDNAVSFGHSDLVKSLLDRPEIEGDKSILNQIFYQALNKGKVDIMQHMLDGKKIDINQVINEDKTALHLAVENNDVENNDKNRVDFLLKQKAIDVNQENSKGLTALHNAVLYGDIDMVKYLLKDRRVDVNKEGKTALQVILEGEELSGDSFQNTQIAHALLEYHRVNFNGALEALDQNRAGFLEADCIILKADIYFKTKFTDFSCP